METTLSIILILALSIWITKKLYNQYRYNPLLRSYRYRLLSKKYYFELLLPVLLGACVVIFILLYLLYLGVILFFIITQ